jgi:hypothetical protein
VFLKLDEIIAAMSAQMQAEDDTGEQLAELNVKYQALAAKQRSLAPGDEMP